MPRLSKLMLAALRDAADHNWLECRFGIWRHSGTAVAVWHGQTTINALVSRGLLRHDGQRRVITPAGREAIGMKEGEDHGTV